ncbi:MAG: GNAT family N-acetyltransferase [Pseudonocardiaceae bacterium]
MEPVEINAGAYYLRQLRADDRLDDRPALIPAFADPEMRRYVPQYTIDTLEQAGEYVASRAAEWADGLRCSWAIAEPTSGRLLGEVGLKNLDLTAATGEVAVWVHSEARGKGVAATAVDAAVRFGVGALGLVQVDFMCDEDNRASAALARHCGFELVGPTESPAGVPSLLWEKKPDAQGR